MATLSTAHRPLRIGIIQYDPKITEVEENVKRVKEILKNSRKGQLDLLCLPETALTGYVFPTPKDVLPYLEEPKSGPTSQLCRELAKELGCFVIGGYPERLPEDLERPPHQVGANSAIMYDTEGNCVGNHRKVNMFESDLPWVCPGKEFTCLRDLPPPLGTVTIGICMDLNPLPGYMEWPPPCELASFALSNRSHILIILCAWLDSKENLSSGWDVTTIQFWIERLLPLWSKTSPDLRRVEGMEVPEDHDETVVVICNRTGLERGSLFAGCSLVIKCSRSKGKWEIIGLVDKNFEGAASWIIE